MAAFPKAPLERRHDSGIQARKDASAAQGPLAAAPAGRTAAAVQAAAPAASGAAGAAVPEQFAAWSSALHAAAQPWAVQEESL